LVLYIQGRLGSNNKLYSLEKNYKGKTHFVVIACFSFVIINSEVRYLQEFAGREK
jgi:hypothetical protein